MRHWLVAVVSIASHSQAPAAASASSAQPPAAQQATAASSAGEEKASTDAQLARFTLWLVGVGALQLVVFGYQAKKLRETVEAARQQSVDMKSAITEMARLAAATEASVAVATASATSVRDRTSQQLRAYISVQVGTAVYQERAKNLYFEGRPIVVNDGQTPAHNVSFRTKADILPVPLPPTFTFPALAGPAKGGGVFGPHQTTTFGAILDRWVPDQDVSDIKAAKGHALYVWGVLTYDDVFGVAHTTKFAQICTWWPNDAPFIYYADRHNEAD